MNPIFCLKASNYIRNISEFFWIFLTSLSCIINEISRKLKNDARENGRNSKFCMKAKNDIKNTFVNFWNIVTSLTSIINGILTPYIVHN